MFFGGGGNNANSQHDENRQHDGGYQILDSNLWLVELGVINANGFSFTTACEGSACFRFGDPSSKLSDASRALEGW